MSIPETLQSQARENLERLQSNPYPGRGIVLGRSADSRYLLQLYWIMGRSENSRNRVFVEEAGQLRTQPLHPEKMKDPGLVIYTAMDTHSNQHVVTNGDQTDTVMEALRKGGDYRDALRGRAHEPDAPHYTPRISGGILAPEGRAWMSILKADPAHPSQSLRCFYEMAQLSPGLGWCLTTYQGDGNPLPSFSGEPYPLPLEGESESLLASFWNYLDGDNKISLALKRMDTSTGEADIQIINKYSK